jgi:hypothetical protein
VKEGETLKINKNWEREREKEREGDFWGKTIGRGRGTIKEREKTKKW